MGVEELAARVAGYRKRGRRPKLLSTNVGRDPLAYIGLFEENPGNVAWEFTPWLTAADHDAALAAFKSAGMSPQCACSAVKDGEVRYTVVWSDVKP